MDEIVEPVAEPVVRDLGAKCIVTDGEGAHDAAPTSPASRARSCRPTPTAVPSWSERLRQNSLGSASTRTIPLLVAQGLDRHDRAARGDRRVRAGAVRGRGRRRVRPTGTGHFQVRTASATAVREWLLERLDGDPLTPGCTETAGPTVPG